MLPLTADCPKPLLPVGAASLVEHQIAWLTAVGVERVVLATGYRHEDFAGLVRSLRAKGVELTTVVEATPQGTGGGLREALRSLPGADEVVVVNGDLLTGHDLRAQTDSLRAAPSEVLASVHVRTVPDARPFGSVVTDDRRRITAFVEKSENPPSMTVNAGTYVVRAGLVEEIPDTGAVSLERDVFPRLADRGALVPHAEDAYFLDVGSPEALVTANRDLVLGRGPLSTSIAERLVLPGAHVAADARLGMGTVVHPGAVVGPRAVLESALVLPDAKVGACAEVSRSVVGRGSVIGERAHLSDSAVGTDRRVRPGERLAGVRRPPD